MFITLSLNLSSVYRIKDDNEHTYELPAGVRNIGITAAMLQPGFESPRRDERADMNAWIEVLKKVPRFEDSLNNLTVSLGREAVFTCVVNDLGSYRVAWLRVDTQTILTIATHVITKNHRIAVNHSDRRVWFLHIHDVRQSDRGWYMCQLNTDPMKSQTAYLDVVVPPDILDYPTSSDQVAREGANVTLRCAAHGVPTPTVVWRKEAGDLLPTSNFSDTHNSSVNGAVLQLVKVSRLHMGAYLCIASNGVPPSVSKRVMLVVHSDKRFEITAIERGYEVDMRLKIKKVGRNTFGTYSCISKNSLGDTDGTIKLYYFVQSTKVYLLSLNTPYWTPSLVVYCLFDGRVERYTPYAQIQNPNSQKVSNAVVTSEIFPIANHQECGVHWCDAPASTRTLAGNKVGIKRATCLTIRRVVRANSLFVHEAQPPSKLGRLKNDGPNGVHRRPSRPIFTFKLNLTSGHFWPMLTAPAIMERR
ncbi:unnamed protein product [Spodoptera exigua]|nr:unnamed protein product [Spodoptera exigua]